MYKEKKILAVIPARGGSKLVPKKNIKNLGGKPLIAWTIKEALDSKYIDNVVLSSDDDEIIEVAKKYGCNVPFKRPVELAADETPSIVVVLHAIERMDEYDYVVLLQPTSPFRTAKDIDSSIELCMKKEAVSCVSLTEATENPNWMYFLDDKMNMLSVLDEDLRLQRQKLATVYKLNGAIYIVQRDWVLKHQKFVDRQISVGYIMSGKNSLDIDEEEDFRKAEQHLIGEKLNNN